MATKAFDQVTKVAQGGCDAIEQEIQAKGLTAPRITPADIEANIYSEHYFTAADGVAGANEASRILPAGSLSLLTFCVLVLRNGFTVTGESACASPENFDAEIGRKIARQNAVQKIWPLMGYELRSRLHQRATTCTCGPNEGCSRCGIGMSGK
ncbi:Gp49 family protein [Pseudomonas sp. NPDC077649]|uniref:Gp49 family protein n=1 Tax=Pseudomonas sp. NPDC077649 TaxID=3364423 RepID=UPI0037C7079D